MDLGKREGMGVGLGEREGQKNVARMHGRRQESIKKKERKILLHLVRLIIHTLICICVTNSKVSLFPVHLVSQHYLINIVGH